MISVTVKTLDSQNHIFEVEEDISVKRFKEIISSEIGIPVDEQRLIFRGKVMQDDMPISEYNIGGNVVHVVTRPPNQNPTEPGQSTSQTGDRMGSSGAPFSTGGGGGLGTVILHTVHFAASRVETPSAGQEDNRGPRQIHLITVNNTSLNPSTLLQQMGGSGTVISMREVEVGNGGNVTSPSSGSSPPLVSSPPSVSSPPPVSSRCGASFCTSPSQATLGAAVCASASASNNNPTSPSVKKENPVDRTPPRVSDEVDIDEVLPTPPSMVQAQAPVPNRSPQRVQAPLLNRSPERSPGASASNSPQGPSNPFESVTSLLQNLPSEWEAQVLNDVRTQNDMPPQEEFTKSYTSLVHKKK